MNVIIMRGLPGSGKSSWINSQRFINSIIVSADDFFTDPRTGQYCFNKDFIGEAHKHCLSRFLDCLRVHTSPEFVPIIHDTVLIVDNTNIRAYEISPYIALANVYGIDAQIKYIYSEPRIAAERNVHGVTREVIFGMYCTLLHEQLPPFWKQEIIF